MFKYLMLHLVIMSKVATDKIIKLAGFDDKPTLEELKDWLREEHDIEVNVFKSMSIDLYDDDLPETIYYSYTVNNWKVRWSIHDGTGFIMPEHYHEHGESYYDTLEKGIIKGLELIKTDE